MADTYYLAEAFNTGTGVAYDPNGIRCSILVDAAAIIAGTQKVYTSAGVEVTPSTLDADDIIVLVAVPEGTYVDMCETYVHTVNGAQAELDIGLTAGDVDAFANGADLYVLGSSAHTGPAYGPAGATGCWFFAANDTIDALIMTAALTTAKVTVSFSMCMIRGALTAG